MGDNCSHDWAYIGSSAPYLKITGRGPVFLNEVIRCRKVTYRCRRCLEERGVEETVTERDRSSITRSVC